MAKKVCTILGFGFLLVGILGFIAPALLGMHLSTTHSVIHLVTGMASLYFGLRGKAHSARLFSLIFGTVYALLGVAGFVAGEAGAPSPSVPGPHSTHLLKVFPGAFEVGVPDHIVHIILGATFLIGGLLSRKEIR